MSGEKGEHDELGEPRWLFPSTDHFSQQPAPMTSRKPMLADGCRRQISDTGSVPWGGEGSGGRHRRGAGDPGSTGGAPGNAARRRRSPIFE